MSEATPEVSRPIAAEHIDIQLVVSSQGHRWDWTAAVTAGSSVKKCSDSAGRFLEAHRDAAAWCELNREVAGEREPARAELVKKLAALESSLENAYFSDKSGLLPCVNTSRLEGLLHRAWQADSIGFLAYLNEFIRRHPP